MGAMSDADMARRDFLRLVASSPLAVALGCTADSGPEEVEAALRALVLAMGPWGAERREHGEDFASRFVAARGVSDGTRSHAEVVQGLTARLPFRDGPSALEDLDLAGCSAAERQLLTGLAGEIYGILEVQSHLAGVPDVGICAGREQYVRAPWEWSAPYRRTK